MKKTFASLVLAALTGFALTAPAQVQSGTNTISGLFRFVNTDPDILARLGPPGNEGMTSFAIYAYTDPPDVLQSSKSIDTADPITSPYALTVTADGTPRIASSDIAGILLIHDSTPGHTAERKHKLAESEGRPGKGQGRQEASP